MDLIAEEQDSSDLLLSLSQTNSFYEEQLKQVTNKVKRYEAKLKNKTLKFTGYEELNDYSQQDDIKEISNDLKKKLYQAIVNEDLVTIEDILSLPESNINITWFSENLLMCSIRNRKAKIAEYFINKGINVNFKVELLEFKQSNTPLNYTEYSCRSMAYDKGLYNIVDLIDIFDPKSDPKIVRFLCERYIRENFREEKYEFESDRLYEARLATNFVSDEADKSLLLSEHDSRKRLSSQNELIEDNMYAEAENVRAPSTNSIHVKFDIPLTKSELLTGNLEIENETNNLFKTNKDILNDLDKSLLKKLKEILEYVKNTLSLSRLSNYSEVKCFNYSGYKVNLELKRHESLPPIPYLSSRLGNRIIKESKETINLEAHNDIEIKRVVKNDEIVPPIEEEDISSRKSSVELPSLLQNIKPVIKSDLVVFQYSDDQKYFFKDNTSTHQYSKHLPKIKNYYYINSLKQIPAAQNILLKSLVKYNEQLFPMLSQKNNQQKQINKFNGKKNLNKLNLESHLVKKNNDCFSSNFPKLTENQIKDNYLSSLKRSGLVNKNSKPLFKKLIN